MNEPFDLQRFVDAQGSCYSKALAELRDGRKRSHWMWFVFPQVTGLGKSSMASRYAISGEAEARAYLTHPILGARLEDCCRAILALPGNSPEAVFGRTDALKLRSSATLFAKASGELVFDEVLLKYFAGRPDRATIKILGEAKR